MKIKSFGCSFIFGSELADNVDPLTASQLSWPGRLATHLNYAYECYARPGSGNLQILEQVLNQAEDSSRDLYVIGWTWIDRFDYYSVNELTDTTESWQTIMPGDNSKLAQTYYHKLHSEFRDTFTSLSYIKLSIDTLKQNNIPFIMTYMDNLLFDRRWNTSPAVTSLQNYIQPYMTTFDGDTFLEWSRKNNYPETKKWHPLESAHRAAGEYIIRVFDKQNTIDC